jgi:predicted DNA-binding protein (MmcQ/YjbR family)
LPETDESTQFGSPVWRVSKRSFAMLYDYGKGLTVQVWVGIERQGPLEMDPRLHIPPYLGTKGWIALDGSKSISARELREFLIESYRHFATRRALGKLDA